MMFPKQSIRKLLSVSLAVTLLGGTAVTLPANVIPGLNTVAQAASASPVVTVGSFQYILYSDSTAKIVGYTGSKNLSTSTLALPTVIYSKDIDTTWSYNQYIGSYSITQMQGDIFSGCTIKLLSLPRNLTGFTGALTYGAEIGGFYIDSGNTAFSTNNNINALTSKSGTTLYAYPSKQSLYNTAYSGAFIPSSVTSIDMGAFTNCKLTSISIPATVTSMGKFVFENASVTSITFEGNSPSFRLPENDYYNHTFSGASSLTSVTINGTGGSYVTDGYGMIYTQGYEKFIFCPQGRVSAFNINNNCTTIGEHAFYKCSKLSGGVVMYDNVVAIGGNAFESVNSNFKIYGVKNSYAETFASTHNITFIEMFEYSNNSDGTVTITKYNGPYSSPSVPAKLNKKTVSKIGDEAFKGNTNITSVYPEYGITAIGDKAFYGCTNLKNANLPSSIASIGNSAFYNTALTKITIPASTTSIGERAFYNCKSLTQINFHSNVQSIATYAFGFCTALEEVTMPKNMSTIAFAAFYGCSNLTTVNLNDRVTFIGGAAFCNTGLTGQYIPPSVTTINNYGFGYNYANSTYTRDEKFTTISGFPDTRAQYYAEANDITFDSVLEYTVNSDDTVTINGYNGNDTTLSIPATIEGKPVTSIKGYGFNGSQIEELTLPSSFTEVPGHAFYGCYKLKKVNLPNTITSIGTYAFEFCWNLTTINFPARLAYIKNGAFYGCTSLTSVAFNNSSAIRFNSYSFVNTGLTSVTIPKNVVSIGDYAFGYTYSDGEYHEVEGFKMTGYAYTAAEEFAAANPHITFNALYEDLANTSTISASSVVSGKSVTLYGSSTGGKKPITYAYSYQYPDSTTYYSLSGGYVSNTSYDFTPNSEGVYTLRVIAKDARGYTSTKTFPLTVTRALGSIVYTDKDEIVKGESVAVTAEAFGGKSPYQYAFYTCRNDSDWSLLQAYSSSSTCTYKPSYTGTYGVRVYIKDANGDEIIRECSFAVVSALKNTSTLSAATIKKGDSVTITGAATGGKSPYTFAYYYNTESNQTWKTIADFTSATEQTFKPSYTGKYNVKVIVKDTTGATAEKVMTLTVDSSTPLKNLSTISATSVPKKTTVTMTAVATGGTAPYTYSYYYKKSTSSSYTRIGEANTTNTTASFTPSMAATYQAKVVIKDKTGTTKTKFFTVEVTSAAALSNTSTISAETVKKGTAVTITGSATGGTAPYTYSFAVQKQGNSYWTTLDANGASSITYKPASATTYKIRVIVTDKNGATDEKILTLIATAT